MDCDKYECRCSKCGRFESYHKGTRIALDESEDEIEWLCSRCSKEEKELRDIRKEQLRIPIL
jgi:hypothetical protein